MAYRIVICVDVHADDLEQAYAKVYDYMACNCGITDGAHSPGCTNDIDWESSDEAFDHEGEPVDPDVLQEARMAFFAKRKIDQE